MTTGTVDLFSDELLARIGLDHLDRAKRDAFFAEPRTELEIRVGEKLAAGLSDEQLDTFEALVERVEDRKLAWLFSHCPDYADDPVFHTLSEEAAPGAPEIVILAEYASLRWLELNRPHYRNVIRDINAAMADQLVYRFTTDPRPAK